MSPWEASQFHLQVNDAELRLSRAWFWYQIPPDDQQQSRKKGLKKNSQAVARSSWCWWSRPDPATGFLTCRQARTLWWMELISGGNHENKRSQGLNIWGFRFTSLKVVFVLQGQSQSSGTHFNQGPHNLLTEEAFTHFLTSNTSHFTSHSYFMFSNILTILPPNGWCLTQELWGWAYFTMCD